MSKTSSTLTTKSLKPRKGEKHIDYVMRHDKEFLRGYIEGLLEVVDALGKRKMTHYNIGWDGWRRFTLPNDKLECFPIKEKAEEKDWTELQREEIERVIKSDATDEEKNAYLNSVIENMIGGFKP